MGLADKVKALLKTGDRTSDGRVIVVHDNTAPRPPILTGFAPKGPIVVPAEPAAVASNYQSAPPGMYDPSMDGFPKPSILEQAVAALATEKTLEESMPVPDDDVDAWTIPPTCMPRTPLTREGKARMRAKAKAGRQAAKRNRRR